MTAYYNEIDPNAASWLRELIKAKKLPAGDVDTRSIVDVQIEDLKDYNQHHFFAGIGGWPLALNRAGWGDIPVTTGSCPCQPFSTSGSRKGFNDERHLWKHFFRLIQGYKPCHIFGEQVASKAAYEWVDLVQNDLEGEGYTFGAYSLCAASVGAPHIRQRIYWMGHSPSIRRHEPWQTESLKVQGQRSERNEEHPRSSQERELQRGVERLDGHPNSHTETEWTTGDSVRCWDKRWRPIESGSMPLVDGIPQRLVKLRGYGNAIVVPLAQVFIESYIETIIDTPLCVHDSPYA